MQNSQENICASLFFNKVTGLRPSTLLKKRLQRKCFPVNFAKFTRTTFLKEHLWGLFLTLFRIGFFGAAHEWNHGAAQEENLSQISYNVEAWHSYTLPKKGPKNI